MVELVSALAYRVIAATVDQWSLKFWNMFAVLASMFSNNSIQQI